MPRKEVDNDVISICVRNRRWHKMATTYLPGEAAKSSLITTNNTTLGTQARAHFSNSNSTSCNFRTQGITFCYNKTISKYVQFVAATE
jgi:hypothetical protein